jgi:hypothetical protein
VLLKSISDLHNSSSIFFSLKQRKVRQAEHVAREGEKRNACRILWGNPKERDRNYLIHEKYKAQSLANTARNVWVL